MVITTTDNLQVYLISKGISLSGLNPLSGGSTNLVWRGTFSDGKSVIIKHAAPFLASNPSTAFPVHRQTIEVHALEALPLLLPHDDSVSLPKRIYHDPDENVLILDDVCGQTLHDIYEEPGLDIPRIGQYIGRWLARLHVLTTEDSFKTSFDHAVIKSMYRWSYNNLADVMKRNGLDPSLGERINAKYGSLIEFDNVCVCHTDIWPGNILVQQTESELEPTKITIIDWEAARIGDGVTDVGHFAAEAWFLDQFKGGRHLSDSFLRSYVEENDQVRGQRERARIVAQFGVHLVFWPTIYEWISENEKVISCSHGYIILEKLEQEDWEWFKHTELGVLFR